MFKKLNLFPVKRAEWQLFLLMFIIVCLININFSILRSARNALVVADTGGSASFIPYFELFGTFPASILLTWGLTRLMRKFSLQFIFSAMMIFFLSFFIIFAFCIYPHRAEIHTLLETKLGFFFGFSQFKVIFTHWPDLIFYVMAELWKVSLLSVLFWGFLNQNLFFDEAKRFYPPLMLGSSIGSILSGPITVFCTSQYCWNLCSLSPQHWQHSLYFLTIFLFVCGFMTLIAFKALYKRLQNRDTFTPIIDSVPQKKEPFLLSLSSSIRYLAKSPYLLSLFLIVIAEYVSYSLGELIFLDTLKEMYPSPSDYCQYMGKLTLWMGFATAFSAIVLTPYLLNTYRWNKTALATPVLMVIMTLAFFTVICLEKFGFLPSSLLPLAVALGSFHFCVGRATKYTLFDSAKELAFIPLNQEAQVKGKLIIDGIGSRFGRGTSSFLNILLFLGGPGESALFAGILAITFALISIPAARFVGNEFEKMQPTTKSASVG